MVAGDDLAVRQGQALSAAAMPALGTNDRVDVRNESGQAQVQVDVGGYFIGGAAAGRRCRGLRDAVGGGRVQQRFRRSG